MFSVDILQSRGEGAQKILDALKVLNSHEVMIGIPDDAPDRKNGDPVSNAELLFIHTNGSPVHGIPPRPVLKPAIEENKDRISADLKNAIDTALRGDAGGILPALEKAGLDGQNIARKYFTDANGWPPNKGHSDTVSKKPLIDTDEMRKSITYVVREV